MQGEFFAYISLVTYKNCLWSFVWNQSNAFQPGHQTHFDCLRILIMNTEVEEFFLLLLEMIHTSPVHVCLIW